MRMERSQSNKRLTDQEYIDWKQSLIDKHEKDLDKIDKKWNKIDLKSKILKEVNYLRDNDMQTNFKREILKLKFKKDKLMDKQINNRERVKRLSHEKQKAIEKQMEINRIVQQQAQQITFI